MEGPILWVRALFSSLGDAVRKNVSTLGGAFCVLFVVSLGACAAVISTYGDGWDEKNPVGLIADISGASFAISVLLLSLGRVSMSLKDIFRDKRAEAARQEGRQEERELAIRADKERLSGESIEQAMDRLRESKRS